MNIQILTTWF